jgi:hypothetical protein
MSTPQAPSAAPFRDQPRIRLPMWKLTACLLAAPKLVLYTALAVLVILGGDLWDDRLKAEVWASVVLYTGVGAGLLFLWPLGARPVFAWGPLVITASLIRMAVSVGGAVAIYSAVHPERTFFWTVFLLASLAVLAVETAVIRRALRATIGLAGGTQAQESRAA